MEEMYDKLLRLGSAEEQRAVIRDFEKQALETQAHMITTLWWYKINAYRSYVKGWKISPSHYLNQHLDNVWLDK
jgi:peptide/nickel transport system substrate-binding protein